MSSTIWATINPDVTSGTMLAAILTDFKDALMSGLSGSSRPANLQAGGSWLDTSHQSAPDYYWSYKVFDGTDDHEVFRISVLHGYGGTLFGNSTFEVDHIAEDAVGPIVEFIKQRDIDNGQIKSGDSVGELRLVGRTDTATSPVVAYLKFAATDDMTTSESGGTFSIFSTPDASSAISEHLRMIGGNLETVVALKVNALRYVSQNVATTAAIPQLTPGKLITEMTGSTATDIQGILNTTTDGAPAAPTLGAQVVIIHNRSSAIVTLKHQNASALAADRMKLPGSLDVKIAPDGSATLYYSKTESRWKLKSASGGKLTKTIESYDSVTTNWTAPSGITNIKLTAFRRRGFELTEPAVIDIFGNAYAWGTENTKGRLGVGNATSVISTPTLVARGFKFNPGAVYQTGLYQLGQTNYGIDPLGQAYGWGFNTSGEIGDGTNAHKSSPVAVVGTARFVSIYPNIIETAYGLTSRGDLYAWGANGGGGEAWLGTGDNSSGNFNSPQLVIGGLKFARFQNGGIRGFGLLKDGSLYAWGLNSDGGLGVGDRTSRSSPVAVVGGFKFKKISANGLATFGIATNGNTYAWGTNSFGMLGVGDTVNRSSPVLVLGGISFKQIINPNGSSAFPTYGLAIDGTLYAWGRGEYGQLGAGSTLVASSPVAVLGGLKFAFVSAEDGFSAFGIATDGTTYAWGRNDSGQLGLGDRTHRSSPVAVLGGYKFNSVFCRTSDGSFFSTIAMTLDGLVYVWGTNGYATPANGSFTASSPVLVVGLGGNPSAYVSETSINVTPGNSYVITIADGQSYFDNTPLGLNIDNITIEYHK